MGIGPVMLDVAGKALTPEDEARLKHPLVGGVILFARNFESPRQIAELCASIHALRTPPLGTLEAIGSSNARRRRCRISELHSAALLDGGLHRVSLASFGKRSLNSARRPSACGRKSSSESQCCS